MVAFGMVRTQAHYVPLVPRAAFRGPLGAFALGVFLGAALDVVAHPEVVGAVGAEEHMAIIRGILPISKCAKADPLARTNAAVILPRCSSADADSLGTKMSLRAIFGGGGSRIIADC